MLAMIRKHYWIMMLTLAMLAGGLGFESKEDGVTSRARTTRSDTSNQQNELPLMLAERASTSNVTAPEQIRDGASAYREYKKKRVCFSLLDTSVNDLLDEIASLRQAVKQYSPSARKEYETAIDSTEKRLRQKNECMAENEHITKKELSYLLAVAAAGGDRDAQLEYAKQPMFDVLHTISDLESMRKWRETAPVYVDTAVKQGDPRAILLLAEATDPYNCRAAKDGECGGVMRQVVESGPAASYRYYRLLQLVAGSETPGWVLQEMSALKALMSTDDLVWAEQEAQKNYQSLRKGGA